VSQYQRTQVTVSDRAQAAIVLESEYQALVIAKAEAMGQQMAWRRKEQIVNDRMAELDTAIQKLLDGVPSVAVIRCHPGFRSGQYEQD